MTITGDLVFWRRRLTYVAAALVTIGMNVAAAIALGELYGPTGILILGAGLLVSISASLTVVRRSARTVAAARASRLAAAEQTRALLVRRDDLARIANSDALDAQLGNRRSFEAAVGTLGAGDLLVLGDISGLKEVNDLIGHSAGDALLIAVGAAIRAVARGRGEAYRFTGGDEYALILRDLPPDRVPAILAEIDAEVAAAIAAEPILDGARTWLRTGWAHGTDGDGMRARADAMLTARWQEEHLVALAN